MEKALAKYQATNRVIIIITIIMLIIVIEIKQRKKPICNAM